MRVLHESWTVQDGAPENTTSLAQTTDGFLWLGGSTGLFRFDGTRFERFRALSEDQLLSSNVYAISAAPSGGLWVVYTFGGFSFVKDGRVTNYTTATTGSIHEFAQDANGIVWAASTSGLWRFEHSTWQHVGTEWNAPNSSVGVVAFDRTGVLWVLAQKTLFCLRPGEKRFRIAGENLGAWGFTLDADRKVITNQSAHHQTPRSSRDLDDGLPARPILLNGSVQIVDRTNSVWILGSINKPLLRIPSPRRLTDALSDVNAANPEKYDIHPGTTERSILDNEGNLWFCDEKGTYRARAYLLKGLLRKELLEAIRAVHRGEKRIPPEVAAVLADHVFDEALTAREIDVLRLIAGGNANKLIGDQLSITEETVKGYVKSIVSKLGVSNRTHAVTVALKRGIIDL